MNCELVQGWGGVGGLRGLGGGGGRHSEVSRLKQSLFDYIIRYSDFSQNAEMVLVLLTSCECSELVFVAVVLC